MIYLFFIMNSFFPTTIFFLFTSFFLLCNATTFLLCSLLNFNYLILDYFFLLQACLFFRALLIKLFDIHDLPIIALSSIIELLLKFRWGSIDYFWFYSLQNIASAHTSSLPTRSIIAVHSPLLVAACFLFRKLIVAKIFTISQIDLFSYFFSSHKIWRVDPSPCFQFRLLVKIVLDGLSWCC